MKKTFSSLLCLCLLLPSVLLLLASCGENRVTCGRFSAVLPSDMKALPDTASPERFAAVSADDELNGKTVLASFLEREEVISMIEMWKLDDETVKDLPALETEGRVWNGAANGNGSAALLYGEIVGKGVFVQLRELPPDGDAVRTLLSTLTIL